MVQVSRRASILYSDGLSERTFRGQLMDIIEQGPTENFITFRFADGRRLTIRKSALIRIVEN